MDEPTEQWRSFSIETFGRMELEGRFTKDFHNIVHQVAELFIRDMKSCCAKNESVGVGGEYIPFKGECGFIFIWKTERASKWFFWRKEHVQRSVLRVVNAHIYRSVPEISMGTGIKSNDPPGVRCELYLADPRLRDIAQCVLEPYVEANGYLPVQYIDMSNDPSAWFQGERPELPKARLLNA